MTDGPALLRAICADPDDDTARLVFADWLEENGQPERAEFIRVQVELGRGCLVCNGSGKNVMSPCNCSLLLANEKRLLPPNGRNARAWFPGEWWGDWLCNVCPDLSVTIIHPDTGIRFDPPPRMRFSFSRGFVSSLTCTADDWLKHADAIYWEPGQTEKKEQWKFIKNRFGGTELGCFHEDVQRPCPPTAQPIERVTLTTINEFPIQRPLVSIGGWKIAERWSKIEFDLKLDPILVGAAELPRPQRVLNARWHGMTRDELLRRLAQRAALPPVWLGELNPR